MGARGVAVQIVPATTAHAHELAPRMRPAEVDEVRASGRHSPLGALLAGLEVSSLRFAALFDGEVACMWGVVPMRRSSLVGRIGAVWLLTSDLVERHPKAFWRGCKAELPRLFGPGGYDLLVNAIDCRHERAVRWARRLGFPLEAPQAFGAEDLPFHWFRLSRGDLHV
jgi:hypothetical protein